MMNDRRRTYIALLAATALFMEMLDATIIVTALPTMAHEFGRSALDLNIAIVAYTIAVAVLMPISGWLSALLGTRTVFNGAVALFTVASLLCAASTTLTMLTIARVLQGAGGAMMIPVGRLSVLRGAQKSEIIRLVAILTWPALIAPVLGPLVGGVIVTHAAWQWIFLLNVPLGMIALVVAWRLLPHDPAPAVRRFDGKGAMLFGVASVSITVGLDRLGQSDAAWGITLTILCLGLIAGLGAVRHFLGAREPLFRLNAMRHRSFAIGIVSGSVFRIVLSALPFLLPLLFQVCFGMSPVEAGSLLIAVFVGNITMKPLTSAALKRFGFRKVLYVSGLVVSASVMACALFTATTPYPAIAFTLFVSGLARSMQFTAFNTVTFADVGQDEMADANTFSSVATQVTASLGVAVSSCVLRVSALAIGTAPDAVTSFRCAFLVLGALAGIASLRLIRLPDDIGASLAKA